MPTVGRGHALNDIDAPGATHTAREISQQPDAWRETGATTLRRRDEIASFLDPLLARVDLRVVLTGAGTSAFAGNILAPALSRELDRRVDAIATTDIVSNPYDHFAQDIPTLLISFARSGQSPESIAATNLANECLSEVYHLVVTCNVDGELYRRHCDAEGSLALLMPAQTNDQSFAMTSSVTCMMLATWLSLRASDQGAQPAERLIETLARAAEQGLDAYAGPARELAQREYQRIVYLGSGALTGLARESALKLLELTAGGVVTYFDSALGFRHGPKSVLDDHTLAIVYLSNDPYTRRYDLDIAAELRAAIGPDNVVVIGSATPDEHDGQNAWLFAGLADVDDSLLALPLVVCAQMLGLYFSIERGKTPDNPFPSGEVNRVVQGVTIYPLPSPNTAS